MFNSNRPPNLFIVFRDRKKRVPFPTAAKMWNSNASVVPNNSAWEQ